MSKEKVSAQLLPWQTPQLLAELGLLTRDGALNADANRKLKQVNHFVRLVEPGIRDVLARHPNQPVFCEFGSGNAYLGIGVYAALFANTNANLLCVEARPELVNRVAEKAQKLGFDRILSRQGEIANIILPARLHWVLALHACDTATDDAIYRAVEHNADYIALVPCCQAEVNRQFDLAQTNHTLLKSIRTHAFQKREFASTLTNHLRAQVLTALGYSVTVTELVGLEHSHKNELILARKVQGYDRDAAGLVRTLCTELGIQPKTLQALQLRKELA